MTDVDAVDRLWARALRAIQDLFPGYFALVMATGIVSTGLFLQRYGALSDALLWVNLIAYPVLIAATVIRAFRYTPDLLASAKNPQTVFLFHTVVAATNVLGVQLFIRGYSTPALALWVVGFAAWLILGYVAFAVMIFSNERSLVDSVNASWLVAIVGTQSVTVLGANLVPVVGGRGPLLILLVFCLWGIGIALYGLFITFVLYRLFFAKLDSGEMSPPYWIILGATAISALAGSSLLTVKASVPFLDTLKPFVEGMTLLLWAWSTWWMPMLVVLGVWRHIVRRVPVTYNPAYWSLVFPLGMYTVATHRIAAVTNLPPLRETAAVVIWVAVAAWCLTMTGLIRSLLSAIAGEVQHPVLQGPVVGAEKP